MQQGDLGVAVRTAEGGIHPGRIIRVSNDRVTIAFAPIETPQAEVGDAVKLLFRTIRGGELTAAGRLVEEGTRLERDRVFDFCFESPPRATVDPAARLEPVDEDGNCRQAYRVQPERRGIPIVMRPYGDCNTSVLRQLTHLRMHGAKRTVKGWIHDISTEGIGILIDDEVSHKYHHGEHLDISFHLPDCEDPLMVGARVAHRNDARIGTRYGLAFDQNSTAHFPWVQGRVLEFVMREQQRRLRSRAG